MSIDCRFQIAITPFTNRCVPDGIKSVERFEPSLLSRRPWPRICQGRGRCAEGGQGGEVVAERILVGKKPKPIAERSAKHDTEIFYHGSFLCQLDGQVAYQPAPGNWTHYFILVESPVAETHAVRFGPNQTAVVDTFVKHSMPIPLEGQFEFDAWHRNVNALIQLGPDPAGPCPLVVNLCKVNRVAPIAIRRQGIPPEEALPSKKVAKLPQLPHSFAKEVKPLSDADSMAFAPYGQLVADFLHYAEQPSEVQWPGVPDDEMGDGIAGTLIQEFVVRWVPNDGDEPDQLVLEFEGISGSLAGQKGRPGASYSSELGIYKANLLMARPDGSFYLHPSEPSDAFAMAVALGDSQTGEPLDDSLQAFIFRNGQAPRLNPGVWHSVPIPLAGSASMIFTEVIAATNANLVANVLAEAGHPIQFVQAV
uniref:Ureidoglycolate hydrolase n=1 Tax=Globodera pallida TaxID=36090 RepID=A0A183CHR3_GLOPA